MLYPFSTSVLLEGNVKLSFTSCSNGRWDFGAGIFNSGHSPPSLWGGEGSDQ